MTLLPIITAPDPRLKKKSTPVDHVDDATRLLMDNMVETMYAAPGIGLAAPQVGVHKRVIIVDIGGREDLPADPLILANPEVIWVSDEDASYEEGCLSVPDYYADVVRPAAIQLQYLDYENEARKMEAKGLLATCLQHEIDHLDGILFVDHISAIKRSMILRKLLKEKKALEREPEAVPSGG